MPLMLLRCATILLVALVMGLAFAHVLERPAKELYDASLYLTLQKSLYVWWGPPHIGGVLEPLTIVATALLAFFQRGIKREIWLSAGALIALLLAFPVVFFWLVAPANVGFATTTLPVIPANWTDLRSNWELGHTIRFALQLVALALLVASLAWSTKAMPSSKRVA